MLRTYGRVCVVTPSSFSVAFGAKGLTLLTAFTYLSHENGVRVEPSFALARGACPVVDDLMAEWVTRDSGLAAEGVERVEVRADEHLPDVTVRRRVREADDESRYDRLVRRDPIVEGHTDDGMSDRATRGVVRGFAPHGHVAHGPDDVGEGQGVLVGQGLSLWPRPQRREPASRLCS
jgi:hypothetical protein